MAKKRWSQTKGPRAEWSIADTITLLAWLNHSLKHEDVEFETTIVSRLNQAYTLPQINRKLSGLWNKHGPADKPRGPRSLWRDDIFVDGSACLEGVNGLEEDILEKIAESTRILEDEYRLKKAQPAARRLRSTSSLIDFPLLRTTPDTPPKSARTPQKLRHRALSNSLTPSAIKREIEQIQSRDEGHSSVKKKQRRLSGKRTTHWKAAERRPKPYYVPPTSHTGSPAVIEDSEDELSEIPSEEVEDYRYDRYKIRCICGAERKNILDTLVKQDTRSDLIQCKTCDVWQHIPCAKNSWEGHAIPEEYLCELCKPKAFNSQYDSRLSSHTVDEETIAPLEQAAELISVIPTACNDRPESAIFLSTAAEESDTRFSNAKEKINDLEEEMLELKRDLSDRDTAIIALERQIASLRAAQKVRDEQSGLPIEKMIHRYFNKEKRLLAELKIREDGSKFTSLTSNSREWFGSTKLDEGFCDVYSQSRQTLCRHDTETMPFVPALVKHDDLRKLISRCLATSAEAPEHLQEGMHRLSGFSLEAVVRSLITSALAEWVFDTDFPNFENHSSEVLTKYRELLATQDGAVTLRNLDLAARDAMTKNDVFRQQKIPEAAKHLSIRLSHTLAPLFSDTQGTVEESDWDGFATWRDGKEEWTDRRKRFNQMFRFALETKADSCLNIQDYEMLIYPPGTVFDKRTMEVETSNGMKVAVKNYDGRVVGLCLEAAVFAHPRRKLLEDSSIAEAIVTSKNFLSKNKKERVGIEPAVKAVVILSERQLAVES